MKEYMYKFGHVDPWWTDEHRYLSYEVSPMDQSSIDLWTQQGFHNLILHGHYYSEQNKTLPDFVSQFHKLFDWDNTGITLFLMTCGQALPTHQDKYLKYQKYHNISDPNKIYRAVVFLEDWKSGHYFEINNRPFLEWKAGDWVWWNYDTPHFSANVGSEPRYTLQITGTKDEIDTRL